MASKPASPATSHHLPFWKLTFAGGMASCVAEVMTIPLDTIKVRLQLRQGEYKDTVDCFRKIVKSEGPLAMYQGLSAALLRQVFFASIRIGLFDYSIQKIEASRANGRVTLLDRMGVGIFSGAVAICVANPFDVLKVRFQNDVRGGGARRYKGVFDAGVQIIRTEGFWKFYQSLLPNILRNSIINAIELGSYSQIKSVFLEKQLMRDGMALHFTCSAFAGLLAVLFGSPFDVIKSRVMDGKMVDGKKVPYASIFEAVRMLGREKGFLGFYAGFSMNFARLLSWNIVMFMTREQILAYFRRAPK
jgi:solute carrier family 25 uncoupling protein 8/9